MTALYLERYLNYGLTRQELQSGKPIIGIAQTGSDLSPCNRHHIELTKRVRDGVIAAGGTVIEIPVHPIQETGKRPTAMLDRNLAYLSLVETLFGYPIDVTGEQDHQSQRTTRAFQMHYRPNDFTGLIDTETVAITLSLLNRYKPMLLETLQIPTHGVKKP